jgi:predicted MPP superfamily phosphohydrolase
MIKTILLRFRDVVAGIDTIAEHARVLERRGYVWWGWWRKEDESDHARELDEFKAYLGTKHKTVGIFDRSTSRFFSAEAEDFIQEPGRSILSPEPQSTPAYYSVQTVAAWFKFNRINELSHADFVGEFTEPPPGNYTLFPIYSDSEAAAGVPEGGDELQVPGNHIIHISDLHFGSDFGFPTSSQPESYPLLETLVSDIKKKTSGPVGILVVSGDLTTKADGDSLLTDSLAFLRGIVEKLKISTQQVVIVPGNHDIPLRNYEPYGYKHETLMKLLLKEFYGHPVNDFMQLHRFRLPIGRSIEVLTINSVRLRTKSDMNYGYVQWPIYDDFLKKIAADPAALRIAVLHHHLSPAPTEESLDPEYPEAGVSVTLDAGAVTEGLQEHNFRIVLHGHQHVPGIIKIARGRLQDDHFEMTGLEEQLYVVAAGTTGSKRYSPQLRDNSYGILAIEEKLARIQVRRFNSATAPRNHFTAELRI